MRFLAKNPNSPIFKSGRLYKKGNSPNNKELFEQLLAEQKNFCAYTEIYIESPRDSKDVEHFTSQLKYTIHDDYFNYYATLHSINMDKQDEAFANAAFHQSRFFLCACELRNRIRYIPNLSIFKEKDPNDLEAKELLKFLMINEESWVNMRKNHIKRLKKHFGENKEALELELKEFPEQMNFITALEIEFQLHDFVQTHLKLEPWRV